ncbi:hypothetical protein BS78_09G216900 [Paspalum vaginatum]|nr:hypothetical protein BS78_09G216900 [Paspalum vaginatum]
MAAVGARPVLYHHPAPAGDAASMSSYFSHGGSSTSSSASASSFSAALAAAPAPTLAEHFDISEFLFDDGAGAVAAPGVFAAAPDGAPVVPDGAAVGGGAVSAAAAHPARSAAAAEAVPVPERPRTERIAFRTRSEIEILDDGYKWRKYGKKSVKNSPNPRNYYRCSTEGCNVKKRVERDKDDPSYVVTTYEGTHNHVSPSTVYYASQDAASGRFFVAGTHPPASFN